MIQNSLIQLSSQIQLQQSHSQIIKYTNKHTNNIKTYSKNTFQQKSTTKIVLKKFISQKQSPQKNSKLTHKSTFKIFQIDTVTKNIIINQKKCGASFSSVIPHLIIQKFNKSMNFFALLIISFNYFVIQI
ncbi:hypothetical protein ABPG72_021501 [Tetrahymena utriculariae]